MALAHIETVSNQANGVTSLATSALASALGLNELVVVFVSIEDESITASISSNGTSLTWNTIGPVNHSGAQSLRGYLFWAIGNGGGQTTFTATLSSAVHTAIFASAFSGNATSSVTDGTASGETVPAATSHDVSSGITTTTADVLLYCGLRATNNFTPTAGTNYTIPTNGTQGRGAVQYRIVSSTGTYTSPYTTDAIEITITMLAAFKAAGGGGATGNPWYYYAQQ